MAADRCARMEMERMGSAGVPDAEIMAGKERKMNDEEEQENEQNKAEKVAAAAGAAAEIVAIFYTTLLKQGLCRNDALALTAEYMRKAIGGTK